MVINLLECSDGAIIEFVLDVIIIERATALPFPSLHSSEDCLAFLERERLHSNVMFSLTANTVLNGRAPKKVHTIKYLVTQY